MWRHWSDSPRESWNVRLPTMPHPPTQALIAAACCAPRHVEGHHEATSSQGLAIYIYYIDLFNYMSDFIRSLSIGLGTRDLTPFQ